MPTLYVRRLTEREKARALREGHAPCCNLAHGDHPPDVDFSKNPAALDALMRKGWLLDGACYERFFANGRHPRVVVIEGRRLPSFVRRSRG